MVCNVETMTIMLTQGRTLIHLVYQNNAQEVTDYVSHIEKILVNKGLFSLMEEGKIKANAWKLKPDKFK